MQCWSTSFLTFNMLFPNFVGTIELRKIILFYTNQETHSIKEKDIYNSEKSLKKSSQRKSLRCRIFLKKYAIYKNS